MVLSMQINKINQNKEINMENNTEKKNQDLDKSNFLNEQNELENLKNLLKEKNTLIEDYTNQLKRLQSEFENYIKRINKEREDFADCIKEHVFAKLLIIVDEFEKAIEHLTKSNEHSQAINEAVNGMKIVFNNFQKLLKEENVCVIDTKGKKFDPYKHEVLMTVETNNAPDNIITEEIQKGYTHKNKVIRPSKVIVCTHKNDKNDEKNIDKNKKCDQNNETV